MLLRGKVLLWTFLCLYEMRRPPSLFLVELDISDKGTRIDHVRCTTTPLFADPTGCASVMASHCLVFQYHRAVCWYLS